MKNKWMELSDGSYRAAQLLHKNGHYRSAISRAYYSIYAAIVGELSTVKGVHFAYHGNNPTHEKLPTMIRNLDTRRYSWKWKKQALETFNRLWQARIKPDYIALSTVDVEQSRNCLLLAKKLIENVDSLGR